MPMNDPSANLPTEEPPMVELWLEIGESLQVGGRVLHLLDTDGDDAMLQVDRVTPDHDETRWAELPR